MKKGRIDTLLVEKGLAKDIDEARRFIMAGLAISDDKRIDKAGDLVPINSNIRLKDRLPYVSRGALKLKKAIEYFKLDLNNAIVIDIGASTGGFTDICIKMGAEKVFAIDSGFAQLHNSLLQNSKVISFENTNFRNISFDKIGTKADIIVADVSFISLTMIIPALIQFCKENTIFIPLIKPQFEANKYEVEKGGIVTDKNIHIEVCKKVVECAISYGLSFQGITISPIKGAKGNIEYLGYFLYNNSNCVDFENEIRKCVI